MNNNTKYDVIVVGSGYAGSVLARKIAEECNQKVLIVERRNHIGGNAYDEYDENGILIQKYGPHFLATYQWWVIEYLKRFSDFYEYPIKAMSFVDGKYIDRPYNFRTLQQLMGPENSQSLLEKLRIAFSQKHRVTLFELLQCEDKAISNYGQLLYKNVYAPYVAKQWGTEIDKINPEIINRSEIVLGYDTQIVDWDFQYLPSKGYSALFNNMIHYPGIDIVLGENAVPDISFDIDNHLIQYKGMDIKALVFTGAIDELFGEKEGSLPYRSRLFSYETFHGDFRLPCGVVTYPKEKEYIRQTEFKQFNPCKQNNHKTVIQSEYSLPYDKKKKEGNEPYYPVMNDKNIELYNSYKKMAQHFKNLYLCGRLAEYRYYDMDRVVIRAFEVFEKMKMDGIFNN